MHILRRAVAAASLLTVATSASASEVDFTGTWTGPIKIIDVGLYNPMPLPTKPPPVMEIAIEIAALGTRVFVKAGDDWIEVKPGVFSTASYRTNSIISGMDSFKGSEPGWIETWNFTVTRKDDGALYAYWVRAVNNSHMAAMSDPFARFFLSGFGELQRTDKVVAPSQTISVSDVQYRSCARSETWCGAEPSSTPAHQ